MDVFIKDLTGDSPYTGQVWPGPVHFPDWFSPNATEYWKTQLKNWYDLVEFDGIWIDMNEASNFCTGQGKFLIFVDCAHAHRILCGDAFESRSCTDG
jgi:alpha-glucosidase (family GH31 glycosyl hydrolase)